MTTLHTIGSALGAVAAIRGHRLRAGRSRFGGAH